MHPLLSAHDVRKFYGNFAALTGVNLELRRGDRRALIGPNGAGKSTFIGCLAGQIKGANGRIIFKGHDIAHMQPSALARLGIGRTFQISRTFLSMTVFENMMAACAIARNQWLSLGLGTYSKLNETVCEMLRDVGMLDQRTAVVRDLSLGDRKRLEFGMALIGDPDLILLD